MKKIELYDTTLRDGAQREGISLSLEDKIKIALKLDELGIQYIEGGWPGSNPKDIEFFHRIKEENLKNSKIVAFGSTRHKGIKTKDDVNIKSLIESDTDIVCIFGKSWDLHVTSAIITTLEENLKMIKESINFLKQSGKRVFYDAEHFFDGYKNNPEYALETIKVAEKAGAEIIILCDSNGGTIPSEIRKITKRVKDEVEAPLGIHAHNDNDCAVANSLAAVEEGALQVQATVNGYGERCGNANLISIIPNLILKMDIECIPRENLKLLTEVAHHVSEVANVTPGRHQPYVGENAFAHKGGIHISAVLREKGTYEHIDPQLIGNYNRILLSELSGKDALIHQANQVGYDLKDKPELVRIILEKIKKMEHRGYHFEAADGSFEILLRRSTGAYRPLFRLEEYEVTVRKTGEGNTKTEAVVKVWIGDKRIVEYAEGNGPINALDNALRKAIARIYPQLEKIELKDYKVRIIDAKKGTAAVTRVLIESSDSKDSWGTIGVHENIIEASWEALVDSVEFGLDKGKKKSSDEKSE